MVKLLIFVIKDRESFVFQKQRQDPKGIPRRLKDKILHQHTGFMQALQELGSVITSGNSFTKGGDTHQHHPTSLLRFILVCILLETRDIYISNTEILGLVTHETLNHP